MLNIDLWGNTLMQLKVANARDDGDCPCCKHRQFDYLDGKAGTSSTSLCGRNAVQLTHRQNVGKINFEDLAERLSAHGSVSCNEFILRARISENGSDYELSLFPDGRAIVKGTGDTTVAKNVFAKYVGG